MIENVFYEYERDISTNLMAFEQCSKPYKMGPPHFHRCIEMLYMLDGKEDVLVGSRGFKQDEDEIVFVHGYYRHAFGSEEGCRKLVFIIPFAYDDDFKDLFASSTLPPLLADREFNRDVLRPLFCKVVEGKRDMSTLIKKGYLNVILGELLAHYPTEPIEKSGSIEMLDNMLVYIESHCDTPISLDSLATAFGYNKYYLSRLFNRYVGAGLNNYINIMRLRRFMQLYKENDGASVSELAFQSGFESLSTFYRYFDKIYSSSPKAHFATSK